MRTSLNSASRNLALGTIFPLTLLASPVLMGAAHASGNATSAYPTEQYGANCNAETYEAAQLVDSGRRQGVDAIAQPTDSSSHAIVTSQQEFSNLSRENLPPLSRARLYTAVRRLLLSNPYANEPLEHEQAENNCIALLNLQFLNSELSNSEVLVAQAVDPLPVLGPVNGTLDVPPAGIVPTNTPPATTPSTLAPATTPTITPAPADLPASVSPAPAITAPTVAPTPASAPVNNALPPASSAPLSPVQLFAPSSSIDPTNITPTQINPTPFDGAPVSTLSSRPDGNYRYVLADAKNRVFSDAALQQENVPVLVLRKEGNRVIGELMPRFGEPGICVTGIVSGDSISGSAYAATADSELPANTTVYGVLELGALTASASAPRANAGLDLSRFSMINAGSSLPPETCTPDAAIG